MDIISNDCLNISRKSQKCGDGLANVLTHRKSPGWFPWRDAAGIIDFSIYTGSLT
ncbi:hypothetical protein HDE76_002204 [Rhodanobacter sp. ANJX3]|uniref:hypothetical protein n=1 Tax=Rhodanobacter sp. ANJX3 TaxID=2723083 RepID=UPI00160805F2|nr:hypothetical protein [Rhodanobacter sp. ANJX3]MBB5358988.1 hypothetical protein [Rhodanobacter sp. ANJX3]